MDVLAKIMNDAVKLIGKQKRLPEPAYRFLRRYDSMLCVDSVLIPEGKTPAVLLLKRTDESVAPGLYYTIGGRVGKERNLPKALERKIKSETGLSLKVSWNNVVGIGLPYYKPNKKEKEKRNYDVFTPAIIFAVKIPKNSKVKPADGNCGWKIFTELSLEWDDYVLNAVARAWDFQYGKTWRKNLPVKIKKRLGKLIVGIQHES